MKNEQMKKIGNWLNPIFERIEMVVLVFFLLGMALKTFFDINVLLMVSLSVLGLLYFVKAFADPEGENITAFDRFMHRVVFYLMSVSVFGILFNLNHFPGASIMSLVGGVGLIIALIVVFIIKARHGDASVYDTRFVRRMIYVAALALVLVVSTLFLRAKERASNAPVQVEAE
ncbi:hypothetical protein LX69_00411 [Breznakibacter xylanolyticus]|uniref:Uncharacterized protein n=1 Tax=Breznakibacter xylanolyticus TaxID=990 RepID=A0A2W7PAS6_9BACT|nr:hypothetical protein [Breznakibacter xylanolyticus]MBN2742803.1 hypothetical protein [Marinilabiliaceae bacterium]PZX20412.1 hypothetical protein LX69_00411 [Breznakibacter xylanolyticus]